MENHKIEIEYGILWKSIHDLASDAEKKELQLWLNHDEKHAKLYHHLKHCKGEKHELTQEQIKCRWILLNEQLNKQKVQKNRLVKLWLKYAALIAFPLLMAIFYVVVFNGKQKENINYMAEDIQPGQAKATVQLADGTLIELSEGKKAKIKNQAGEIIGNNDSSNVLSYQQNTNISTPEYNTIRIPRGGEYQLKLADGTRVWLNAQTEFTYPVNFVGKERKVQLIGEAYFEVSKNAEKPFIVTSRNAKVQVLGTAFNIKAYEKTQFITLAEGSILLHSNGREDMMKPNQQALIGEGHTEIRHVDAHLYSAWKERKMVYRQASLETIFADLSRWYDVEVRFADEQLKTKMFSMNIERQESFIKIMEIIEATEEIKFEMNEKILEISSK